MSFDGCYYWLVNLWIRGSLIECRSIYCLHSSIVEPFRAIGLAVLGLPVVGLTARMASLIVSNLMFYMLTKSRNASAIVGNSWHCSPLTDGYGSPPLILVKSTPQYDHYHPHWNAFTILSDLSVTLFYSRLLWVQCATQLHFGFASSGRIEQLVYLYISIHIHV